MQHYMHFGCLNFKTFMAVRFCIVTGSESKGVQSFMINLATLFLTQSTETFDTTEGYIA